MPEETAPSGAMRLHEDANDVLLTRRTRAVGPSVVRESRGGGNAPPAASPVEFRAPPAPNESLFSYPKVGFRLFPLAYPLGVPGGVLRLEVS
eukprot:3416027-Pyramimonas_sp.AAC.1